MCIILRRDDQIPHVILQMVDRENIIRIRIFEKTWRQDILLSEGFVLDRSRADKAGNHGHLFILFGEILRDHTLVLPVGSQA